MALPATALQYCLPQRASEPYFHLHLEEVAVPKPKAKEVLLKVHAVCFQVNRVPVCTTRRTLVPCNDVSGEIIAVGDDVKGWKVGDRVCTHSPTDYFPSLVAPDTPIDKSLSQYRTFPAQCLMAIPEHLSYEEASTLPCAAVTAYNALNGPSPVKAGDVVLVIGIGGVSIFALQFAVAAGATVIAISSSEEKLSIASELGAKYIINKKETPEWEHEVNRITKGAGADHIIEASGGALSRSMQTVRLETGHIHVIRDVASEDPLVIFPLVKKIASMRGVPVGSIDQFRDMNRLIAAYPDVTRPIVDKVFPFEETVDAYAYLESKKHIGKVVIKVA